MENVLTTYIYEPSIIVEVVLVTLLLISVTKQQQLISIVIGIMLLRPNERFECYIQYPKVLFAILLLLMLLNITRLPEIILSKNDKLLMFFIAFIFLRTLIFNREDVSSNFLYLIIGLMFYVSVHLFMNDGKGITLLCYATALSCFAICIEPLFYHYTLTDGDELWNRFHVNGRLNAWGMWGNANETAFIASIGVANILFPLVRSGKRIMIVVSAIILPFFIAVVFLTGSRSGLVTLFLIFVPLVFLIKSKAIKVFIVVACLCVYGIFQSMAPERLDKQASTEDRSDLRYQGVQIFKQHPLIGVGFQRVVKDEIGQPLHNTYLQAFAETGLAGGMLLILYMYYSGKKMLVCHNNLKRENKSSTTIALISGLYLSSVFYFFWGNQLLSILFFLVMAQIKMLSAAEESGLSLAVEEIPLRSTAYEPSLSYRGSREHYE